MMGREKREGHDYKIWGMRNEVCQMLVINVIKCEMLNVTLDVHL